ncbi:aldo/keto reductase [Streptomyces sp. TRM68367]|uniref:aldo/keto reductase n=1 Tax=Streptomyces sp. TRM68367 TaxID=2758415 RepID=UPI00165C0CBD|nr:aldo/keto reductase [Streptomyces sp. TRM68367]MBC9730880.1 aldo/keto reductase [Streptomyces sp. TRM68367]
MRAAAVEKRQDRRVRPQPAADHRVAGPEIVPVCQELGIGQIVWSPLAQGVLTGKYKPGQQPPSGSRATDTNGGSDAVAGWMRDEVLARVQELVRLAAEAGMSLATLSLAWVLRNTNVSAAIVGASRPEQIVENAKAADITLDDELVRRVDEILDPVAERDPERIDVFAERP